MGSKNSTIRRRDPNYDPYGAWNQPWNRSWGSLYLEPGQNNWNQPLVPVGSIEPTQAAIPPAPEPLLTHQAPVVINLPPVAQSYPPIHPIPPSKPIFFAPPPILPPPPQSQYLVPQPLLVPKHRPSYTANCVNNNVSF